MNSLFEGMHAAGWGSALIISASIFLINIATRVIFHEKRH